MNEPSPPPARFEVSYSSRVRLELSRLAARAKARGIGKQLLAALKEIERRLRIYPEFGEPLYDLNLIPGQIWIGTVPPLVVRYLIDFEKRLVIVATPFMPLPNSGL